ncbi:MAG TPA: family 20 glycosylhydrolase [Balneolales bacterium]|nr:family 20 glycosylhydrolase [Balneolales bacterium]
MIRKILIGLVIVCFALIGGGYLYYRVFLYHPPAISASDRASIHMMPLPAHLKLEGGYMTIGPDFGYEFIHYKEARLQRAASRFLNRLRLITGRTFSDANPVLKIDCRAGADKYPRVHEDESYTLIVNSSKIQLRAASPYGVLHGLETILQLVDTTGSRVRLPQAVIHDQPRFAWRGLMLDVCRHWMPVSVVLRNLDAMSALKMNVFHWHLSDYQAFRVESKTFPKLQELGSGGHYYTQEQVRGVVNYAADRGIRVIPEFDLPGHSTSWLAGYPQLASAPGPYKPDIDFGVLEPVMNPTKESTYIFLDKFFKEMSALFPDRYIHIGGDEVDPTEWNENEQIQAFMKAHGIADAHALQAYFNKRLEGILARYGKKMIGWDEILNPDLGDSIVIQSWRSQKSLFEAVRQGASGVLSAGYYLDHKLPASRHYKVDPLIMPGAVNIKPDTAHWKTWDLSMEAMNSRFTSQMTLYGGKDSLRGFFNMMGKYNAFDKATLTGNKLTFNLGTDYGDVSFDTRMNGDSLNGTGKLGIINISVHGILTGSSKINGSKPPEIEQMKPLTKAEKKRILGGEACMWAELITDQNVDTRIWPRTAAIAEKLWSPAELTNNIDDMYRRLYFIDDYLDNYGVQDHVEYVRMMKQLTDGKEVRPVRVLMDELEEQKYLNRMGIYKHLTTETPMDRPVDASLPESFPAHHFNQWVDEFLQDSTHRKHAGQIISMLNLWIKNHDELQPYIATYPKLDDLKEISERFSKAAAIGLEAIRNIQNGDQADVDQKNEDLKYLNKASEPSEGMIIAVLPGITKLTENM